MLSIKLNYLEEFRRVSVTKNELSYKFIVDKAHQIFSSSLDGKSISLVWIDEDEDLIKCSSDEELQEALQFYVEEKLKMLKFEIVTEVVQSNHQSSFGTNVVHPHVACDGCGMSPIVGPRFKCTVREDFDLCESCEAKSLQPHAMVKIYRREDSEHFRRGPYHHHRYGRRQDMSPRFHPGHHMDTNVPLHVPTHRSMDSFIHAPCPPHRLGRWAKCSGQNVDRTVPNKTKEQVSSEIESKDIEDKIIADVIRLSVEESCLSADESSLPVEEISQPVEVTCPMSTVPSRNSPTPSKPKVRFVRDVTFPDGTVVQPGTVFLKVWRVRNDGESDWTEGVSLVPAGGDSLSSPDLKVPVTPLQVGQENDIVVELTAPELSGRHVSYFRLQTVDGSFFGHRLWADIRVVADEEADWQVIGNSLNPSGDMSTNSTTSEVESIISGAETIIDVEALTTFGSDHEVQPVIVDDSNLEIFEETTNDIWNHTYEVELKVLRDMGFSDLSIIMPLLRDHIVAPASQGSNPNAEALQRVVMQLLGQSFPR